MLKQRVCVALFVKGVHVTNCTQGIYPRGAHMGVPDIIRKFRILSNLEIKQLYCNTQICKQW
jgi:hypothetical protein